MSKSGFIIRMIERFLPPDLYHLIGDLEEEFHRESQKEGAHKARLHFWRQVFLSTPYFLIESIIWNMDMINNYIKTTWRNLKKNIGFSFINIFGLAASLSICLLIILFVLEQRSYDRFHEHGDRLYRVTTKTVNKENRLTHYATSPTSLNIRLRNEFPEVEKSIAIQQAYDNGNFRSDQKFFDLDGIYTNPEFLTSFGFTLIKGDVNTALLSPNSIILTQETAKKLFGNYDPLGQFIEGGNGKNYTVTGVIEQNKKTHLTFDYLISYSTFQKGKRWDVYYKNWYSGLTSSGTYVLLKKGIDPDEFESKLSSLVDKYPDKVSEPNIDSFVLQPVTDIRLGTSLINDFSDPFPIEFVWFLLGFTSIIVLIACFNYVNLTIARSFDRSKEVGIRKANGAFKSSIIKQFLLEAVATSVIALCFSFIILQGLLPYFNDLYVISSFDASISSASIYHYSVIIVFFFFSIFLGLIAGLYPSVYLASFNPIAVLKFKLNTRASSKNLLRKGLITAQFSFSIIFILTSVILFKQFNLILDADYGFNQDHIITLSTKDIPLNRIKDKLATNPDIQSVSGASIIPGLLVSSPRRLQTISLERTADAGMYRIDENFISALQINLIAGREFNAEKASDSVSSILLSKQTAYDLGYTELTEAINSEIITDKKKYSIIGVYEDFIAEGFLKDFEKGTVLFYEPNSLENAFIRVNPGTVSTVVNDLKNYWSTSESLYPIDYAIFDDQLKENDLILMLEDFLKIFVFIASFAILISCLGLFGMALYSVQIRIKEISIRKVLGATINSILYLLSKEYLVLIIISVSVAIPISWILNNFWLEFISNKLELSISLFATTILAIISIALLTIASQTYKATKVKPIDNLQSE